MSKDVESLREQHAREYIYVFDTTLRDGEQSPGATMSASEKLDVARALAKLGVDIIEAGFPAASPDDLKAVQRISRQVGNQAGLHDKPPVICALARASEGDIDKAWRAVEPAARPRLHTFLATSEIHMKHKLRMKPEEVLDRVKRSVSYARRYCSDVEFSPEDAGRSDPEFLYVVLAKAIEAGATILNIPDTVGYTTPEEFGALIEGIFVNVPGIEDVLVSVHCHDDLGLATANTLAGIRAGARQVEVTVNGVGERAGNTCLEEIVMALSTRRDSFNLYTGIDSTQITRTSKLVANYTGFVVPPNKSIVGANAFAHEAGIHQDGVLKRQDTYEIMRPEMVGLTSSRLVLGKHSGRHAFRVRLEQIGYSLTDDELNKAFRRFKALAEKKKGVTDADLEALVADEIYQPENIYALEGLQVTCGTMGMPTATVRLLGPQEGLHVQAAVGTGPVDAVYKAIDEIVGTKVQLQEFFVHAVTEGIDAQGEVTVRVKSLTPADASGGSSSTEAYRTFGGYGADTDIVVASAKAYLSAINKLLVSRTQSASCRTAARRLLQREAS
ncbi:MAG: 2-isopropylmalate synthase [Anaerolineales bacterium]|nr:2-isopropylmalate synthase [Anaerolineales bacterium]